MRRVFLLLIGVFAVAIGFGVYARLSRPLSGPLTPEKISNLPVERRPVIMALGDSITRGTTVANKMPDLLAQKPMLVIVGVGFVDIRRGEEKTKENLSKIIEQFQKAGAKVVLAGQEASPSKHLYQELAVQYQVPLIPDLRHGLLDAGGLEPDRVHCNEKGCLQMAEQNVLPVILPLLSKDLR